MLKITITLFAIHMTVALQRLDHGCDIKNVRTRKWRSRSPMSIRRKSLYNNQQETTKNEKNVSENLLDGGHRQHFIAR